jgi:hypothetical protein
MANDERDNQENNSGTSGEDLTAANSDHQNVAPNRGGRTDMGSEQLRSATGNSVRGNKGSGISTKIGVTGSDYDGQVSESNN